MDESSLSNSWSGDTARVRCMSVQELRVRQGCIYGIRALRAEVHLLAAPGAAGNAGLGMAGQPLADDAVLRAGQSYQLRAPPQLQDDPTGDALARAMCREAVLNRERVDRVEELQREDQRDRERRKRWARSLQPFLLWTAYLGVGIACGNLVKEVAGSTSFGFVVAIGVALTGLVQAAIAAQAVHINAEHIEM